MMSQTFGRIWFDTVDQYLCVDDVGQYLCDGNVVQCCCVGTDDWYFCWCAEVDFFHSDVVIYFLIYY